MAGKKNEVEVDVGMDVQSEAITRAFNQIDARIKQIQKEMAQVSATSLTAAKNFRTELNGVMLGFNKQVALIEKFEKNINGPQRRQMQQWDREELAANRLSEEKRRLRKMDDAASRKRLGEIERDERAANKLAEEKRKMRAKDRKDALSLMEAEEKAANKLAEEKRKMRAKDRKDTLATLDAEERSANKLAEEKRRLRARDRREAQRTERVNEGAARTDLRPTRALDLRELKFELNASRDLLDVGARRAATQNRINMLLQRRRTLAGQERRDENSTIQHEIARLRLIDQRIAKLQRENQIQARNNAAPPGSGTGGGGGLFGNAGLTGVFARTAGYGGAAAAIYGTVAALRDGATFALQFEDALARLSAIAGFTETQMTQMGDSIKTVAANSRFSTLELTEAATVLAQAGFTQGEIESSLGSISQLATASGVTIAEATDVVTAAIGSFQLQAGETSRINDVLASALNRTKLNIQQVALGIQYAGTTAHENNIAFDELTATMAVMANAGIRSGSTIGTGLRQFLVDLQTPTDKLTEKMNELGLTMQDIDVERLGLPEVLNRMAAAGFDSAAAYGTLETRAAAAYLVLRNNRSEIQAQIIAQNDVGQSVEAAARGQKSLTAEWQRSKNILNSWVEGGLAPAAEALRDFLGTLNDNNSDPVLQRLKDEADQSLANNRALWDYLETKEALIEVDDRWAERIEKSATAVNKASDAVGAQRTKLQSLDEAIERVRVRHEELGRGGVALSSEVSTLTTRFAGLADYLDVTANSYVNLTKALKEYRLEQLKQLGENLLVQEVETRLQSSNRASKAGQVLATMKQEGVFGQLPKNVQTLIQQVNGNPYNETYRKRLADASANLDGNQGRAVLEYLTNISKAVSDRRSAVELKNDRLTVEFLQRPGMVALQTEVEALYGKSDAEIKATIAKLQKKGGETDSVIARRGYDTLIERAQGALGSGGTPVSTTPKASTRASAAADKEAQMIDFISPVRGTPNVTSKVGIRARPTGANGQKGSKNHQGVDIAGNVGDPVLATADGWVEFVRTKDSGGYGKYIILNHGAGTTTLYAHLSEVLVSQGEQVQQGQIIGKLGQTGTATGPHLHYERKTSAGIDSNPLTSRAKGSISDIAQGSAQALEKAAEEEEKRRERNEIALQRMRVRNADQTLKDDLDLLNDNLGGMTEEQLRSQVETSFKAWEDALRDQLVAEDDRRDATDQERLEHIAELNERIRQKREEVEDAFFQSFLGGIEGALDTMKARWEQEDAAAQQVVNLAQAKLSGLQAPENRGRIPEYVVGFQQRRVEAAQKEYRQTQIAALPARADALEAQRAALFNRSMTDTTLDANELREVEDRMRALSAEAAELRRQYALLNAEEQAASDAPRGFSENAAMWLEDFRVRNGLDGALGFQWSDLFEGMDGAMETAQQSLGGFFSDAINQTKSVGEAFGDMKDAVLRAVGDMIAQLLAKKAFQLITSLATSLFGAPVPTGKFHGGQIKAFTGRYITAGVPNRDSVDARIAKGEYVVRKSAVDSVGVDFMDRLNERGSHALKAMAPKPLIVPRAEQKMNVYVVAPEQRPQMGPNDVLVTIANDIASGGQTKQLIKHVAQGG